ncbi:restriction endonuclease subunit S [Streptococcus hyointestinalis]|nr:restriction endonuclease subunit S [Streptococcus hyointestinalis]
MAKIDTSGWKEFRVGDYFHGIRGTSRKMQGLDEGETPVIAAARYNQGIAGYYDVPSEYENAITISCNGVGCGSTYYHDYPFAITGDAIVLENIGNVPIGALHFIASVYDAYFSRKYSYTDKCSADKAEAECILLPATSDGSPDWDYMESYMKAVMKESEASFESMKKADGEKHAVDVSEWKEFRIGELFDVVKGTRLTKANMIPGDIRFIGSSAMNNGCTAMVGNTENMHPANTITVCYNGSVGETFYQDQPFLASDDVNVLYPKFNMTKEIALFIAPLIKSVSARYNYVDKWKQEDMIADVIKLPVDASGKPDWAYMDAYMQGVMQKSELCINRLKQAFV